MSVTIHLNPEVEAGLVARARVHGMDLASYLEALAEDDASKQDEASIHSERSRRQEAIRKMLEFGDMHQLSFGEPITREVLHEGHRS